MNTKNKIQSLSSFYKEKVNKQEVIKGGPETSRGTTTTVQSGTGTG